MYSVCCNGCHIQETDGDQELILQRQLWIRLMHTNFIDTVSQLPIDEVKIFLDMFCRRSCPVNLKVCYLLKRAVCN